MSPGYREEPAFGRESLFRRKLNQLRTTGQIQKQPTVESERMSRELERNALLENVASTMQQTDKKQMERLTLLDTVTEIYNHDTIMRIFKDEIKRAKRYRFPISLLMVSVDGFAETNSRFGPLTGDSNSQGRFQLTDEHRQRCRYPSEI